MLVKVVIAFSITVMPFVTEVGRPVNPSRAVSAESREDENSLLRLVSWVPN